MDGILVSDGIALVHLVASLSTDIELSDDEEHHAGRRNRFLPIRGPGFEIFGRFEAKTFSYCVLDLDFRWPANFLVEDPFVGGIRFSENRHCEA